MVSCGK